MNGQNFEFFLEKNINNDLLQNDDDTFNDFASMNINLKNVSDISLIPNQFRRKNYNIEEQTIHVPFPNEEINSRTVGLQINDNNVAIILIIKGIIGNSNIIYKKVVYLNEFQNIRNVLTVSSMILKIIDNNNNALEKKIEFGDFIIENGNEIDNNIEFKIIIVTNNNNNNEQRIYEKSLPICKIKLEEYKKKDIYGQKNEESEISKIKITINDNNHLYSNIFYYWQLLRFCKNSQDFFDALRDYFNDNKIMIIEYGLESKYEFKVDLPYIREYIIEIRKNQINYSEYTCCAYSCSCSCYERLTTFFNQNCLNFIQNINRLLLVFLKLLYYSCLLIIRILLQIGEIYFSLVLLGFFLETVTILLTGSQVFTHGGYWVLFIYLNLYLFLFLNIQIVYPLVLQFWEASKFRYIKEKNPFISIVRSIKKYDYIGGENKLLENILDIFCICVTIFYLISSMIYNLTPIPFEVINLFMFILIPLIKSFIIFSFDWYIGWRIIKYTFSKNDNNNNDEIARKLLNFNKFSKKLITNEPNESYGELDPFRLRMYGEGLNKHLNGLFLKVFYSIFSLILTSLSYSIYFKSWKFPLYFILFFFAIFPFSTAIPLDIGCDCCNDEDNHKPENLIKIKKKFKSLKYWYYFFIILINFYILGFLFLATFYDDLEYESVDKRLGLEKTFNNTPEEDFTEQSFPRDLIRNSMCHTSLYNLNFIQLVSLAQAAYITQEGDIIKAKNIYYGNTIFKDSNIIIKKMEFLTQKNDNIVVLRIDFEFTNSKRKLIVFSIRGSTSSRDWLLDLEMYSPSAMFTLIKSIPFIVKDESLASSCINIFLTFPLRMMEDITLIRRYSTKIYDLVDNIIDENKNNSDFIFVGHSLGGGLSKYVATHYKMQSFSVSGPGITPLEYKHQTIFGYNKFFKSSFIDIIPDLDIVPRLEISGGIKYRVLCNKNAITCHSIDRTLCMMGIMCHQEQYTKRLCLSMPNIGESEYSEMKKLKNGNQFCDNYILENEKEKDKCKSKEITDEDSECYYIHLQYDTDTILQKNEYKCLQFRKEDLLIYEQEFKNKYKNAKIEFE